MGPWCAADSGAQMTSQSLTDVPPVPENLKATRVQSPVTGTTYSGDRLGFTEEAAFGQRTTVNLLHPTAQVSVCIALVVLSDII